MHPNEGEWDEIFSLICCTTPTHEDDVGRGKATPLAAALNVSVGAGVKQVSFFFVSLDCIQISIVTRCNFFFLFFLTSLHRSWLIAVMDSRQSFLSHFSRSQLTLKEKLYIFLETFPSNEFYVLVCSHPTRRRRRWADACAVWRERGGEKKKTFFSQPRRVTNFF